MTRPAPRGTGKQRFPNAEIYYKLGNHEVRLERWIQQNAQMFDGMFDLENIEF